MCNCIKPIYVKVDDLSNEQRDNNHFIAFIKDAKVILIFDNNLFKYRWLSYCDGSTDEKVLEHLESHHFEEKETALWYVQHFFNCKSVLLIDLLKLNEKDYIPLEEKQS